MHELDEILVQATANIAAEYFQLPIFGGPPVFRERVHCYELYHQMRCLWPADSAYRLGGEVDKQGHFALEQLGARGEKPDLLVHLPGDMNRNYAIIEVKHTLALQRGVRKDLKTLTLFRNHLRYQRAIYLVFGNEAADDTVRRVEQCYAKFQERAEIELWTHTHVGQPARVAHQIN